MNRFPPLVRQPSVGSSTRASEENDCADVPVAIGGERNETAVRVDTVRMARLMIVSFAFWYFDLVFSVQTGP